MYSRYAYELMYSSEIKGYVEVNEYKYEYQVL